MKWRWSVSPTLLVAAVLLLATGCTNAIDGAAHPAPGLKPNPLLGEVIKQVLLDGTALSSMLNQPFKSDANLPPRFGGPEKLQPGLGDMSPPECAGVTTMTLRSTYENAPVKNLARETWWAAGTSGRVINVAEAVVAMPSVAEAATWFAKFSEQWKKCNGTTVTISGGQFNYSDEISNVRVENSVAAATVYVQAAGASGGRRPEAHAIGLRANCLIEVEVTFFSVQRASDPGTADLNTSAIDITRTMMDKVSSRS
ncbi:hypothetical protein A5634_09260 [Mycobacterium asiaticum]|uniref:PknH-like extracellular domain-containing protein n=1 Tax=Mycobacterium asiaticum TaxID=1790 RepID=A0A1A3NL47_MYCAS|nr:sensor domain-containing protein [Mycobacterium asiaticum]OBK21769.1 hypothetical protein A5634_09260 [Mycobacterium asiaticum]